MKLSLKLLPISSALAALALSFQPLVAQAMNGPENFIPYELQCAPYVHAQGTITRVDIQRGTLVGEVTIGAPSFGRPTQTEVFQVVQKSPDKVHGTTMYQGQNFILSFNAKTSIADVKLVFDGQTHVLRNLVCVVNVFAPRVETPSDTVQIQ